jgi:hypothetical protein
MRTGCARLRGCDGVIDDEHKSVWKQPRRLKTMLHSRVRVRNKNRWNIRDGWAIRKHAKPKCDGHDETMVYGASHNRSLASSLQSLRPRPRRDSGEFRFGNRRMPDAFIAGEEKTAGEYSLL